MAMQPHRAGQLAGIGAAGTILTPAAHNTIRRIFRRARQMNRRYFEFDDDDDEPQAQRRRPNEDDDDYDDDDQAETTEQPQVYERNPPARVVRNTGNLFWWGEGNLKYHDTTLDGGPSTTGDLWRIIKILDIPQGTGYDKRNGLKVHLKNICVRGTIRYICQRTNSSLAFSSNPKHGFFTVYLILDEQPNGAMPVIDDIFTNTTDGLYNTSHRKLENSERFKVLSHRQYQVEMLSNADSTTGTVIYGTSPFMIMMNTDIKSRYADGTTNPPLTNNVFVVIEFDPSYVQTLASGQEKYGAYKAESRVRFTSY